MTNQFNGAFFLPSANTEHQQLHSLTLWRRNYFFNFSTPVYKM